MVRTPKTKNKMNKVVNALAIFALTISLSPSQAKSADVLNTWPLNDNIKLGTITNGIGKPLELDSKDSKDVLARTQFLDAIAYLKKSPTALKLLQDITAQNKELVILVDENGNGIKQTTATTTAKNGNPIIIWCPNQGVQFNEVHQISSSVALIHEMGHAFHGMVEREVQKREFRTEDPQYGNEEERNNIVKYEQPIARELGEAIRYKIYGDFVNVPSVTAYRL